MSANFWLDGLVSCDSENATLMQPQEISALFDSMRSKELNRDLAKRTNTRKKETMLCNDIERRSNIGIPSAEAYPFRGGHGARSTSGPSHEKVPWLLIGLVSFNTLPLSEGDAHIVRLCQHYQV